MSEFIEVPLHRLDEAVLTALLEEYASRDGTDYGTRECSLEEKTAALKARLQARDLLILFDLESETWDLLPSEQAVQLLEN